MRAVVLFVVCGLVACQPARRRDDSDCTAKSCADLHATCGSLDDGCGGTLSCGTCRAPDTCGGGGTANACGHASCTPTASCAGRDCGTVEDGCGHTLSCGTCSAPDTCGGGGTTGVCGRASCTPTASCDGLGCGSIGDGCGHTLSCGTCAHGSCGSDHQCHCTPATCGANACGSIDDGCGGTVACGGCTLPDTCGGGGTPSVCGCAKASCSGLGVSCGHAPDGCGGTLDCGTCSCATLQEGSADALGVLSVANGASVAALEAAGLTANQAQAIVTHRNGPDGQPGTADDAPFATLAALNQVTGGSQTECSKLLAVAVGTGANAFVRTSPGQDPALAQCVLDFVNGSYEFTGLLAQPSANALAAYREGPDGRQDTADDRKFATFADLAAALAPVQDPNCGCTDPGAIALGELATNALEDGCSRPFGANEPAFDAGVVHVEGDLCASGGLTVNGAKAAGYWFPYDADSGVRERRKLVVPIELPAWVNEPGGDFVAVDWLHGTVTPAEFVNLGTQSALVGAGLTLTPLHGDLVVDDVRRATSTVKRTQLLEFDLDAGYDACQTHVELDLDLLHEAGACSLPGTRPFADPLCCSGRSANTVGINTAECTYAYPGDPCVEDAECDTGACVSGRCGSRPDCHANGTSCNRGGDCCSLDCIAAECFACSGVGERCTNGSQCCSGTCTSGDCTAPTAVAPPLTPAPACEGPGCGAYLASVPVGQSYDQFSLTLACAHAADDRVDLERRSDEVVLDNFYLATVDPATGLFWAGDEGSTSDGFLVFHGLLHDGIPYVHEQQFDGSGQLTLDCSN